MKSVNANSTYMGVMVLFYVDLCNKLQFLFNFTFTAVTIDIVGSTPTTITETTGTAGQFLMCATVSGTGAGLMQFTIPLSVTGNGGI